MNLPLLPSWSKTPLALFGLFCLGAVQVANAQDSSKPPPPLVMPPGNGPQTGPGQDGNQAIVGTQEYVQIAPGYLLYAEQFYFLDNTMSSGRAVGHIYIQLPPNFALLGVTFVHADSAQFDVRQGWLVLRGWPEVLVGNTIHRAASADTRMRLTWLGPSRGLTTIGDETMETLPPGSIRGPLDGTGDGSGSGGPPSAPGSGGGTTAVTTTTGSSSTSSSSSSSTTGGDSSTGSSSSDSSNSTSSDSSSSTTVSGSGSSTGGP